MSISVRRISDSPRGPRPATARARTDERAAGAAEAARDAAAGAVYTATAGFGGGAVTLAADGSVLVGHASPGRGDRRRPMSARAAGARSPGGTPRATLPPHRLSLEAEAAAARARLLSRGARASADAHARAVGVGLRGSTLRPRARARPQSARAHWTGFARCARRCPAPARGGPALPPRRPCSPPPAAPARRLASRLACAAAHLPRRACAGEAAGERAGAPAAGAQRAKGKRGRRLSDPVAGWETAAPGEPPLQLLWQASPAQPAQAWSLTRDTAFQMPGPVARSTAAASPRPPSAAPPGTQPAPSTRFTRPATVRFG